MELNDLLQIRNGQAFIAGSNLKAKPVARMHLWEKHSLEEVMNHCHSSAAEVHTALAFYYDNREALDAEYEQHMELLKQVGTSTADFRAKIEDRQK